MAKYPEIKTFRSGFYTDRNGDRVYSAEDIRKPYDAIYTDGIKPNAAGEVSDNLEVVALGVRQIAVKPGFAKLGGAWFENTSNYVIELDEPEATTQYHCIILRNDDNDSVRGADIIVKKLDHIPVVFDLERNDKVYEVCLGYVVNPSGLVSIEQTNIVDTRTEGVLCNVMSGVGAVVVRTYRSTYSTRSENEQLIPIKISQFDRTRDTLTVLVEGRVTKNYTIESNENIHLNIALPLAGTRVDFEVAKNVNAAGADTVVREVAHLTDKVQEHSDKLEYNYVCNGVNDNEVISYMVTEFLRSGTDASTRKFNIIGQFGYMRTMSGEGSTSNPYKLFDFIIENPDDFTRSAILDFSNCSEIKYTPVAGKENLIFNAQKMTFIGANVRTSSSEVDTVVRVFNQSKYHVTCERCRFWITGYKDSIIARNGTFINCRGSITNTINNSYCFNSSPNGILEVFGGEYYAYVADSTRAAAIVGQSGSTSVSVLHGVSVPAKTRSGYYQTHAIYQITGGGYVSTYGLITTLPRQLVSGQSSEVGTIPLSKENII